jgi:calcineurin-like phosphoesterase family protein
MMEPLEEGSMQGKMVRTRRAWRIGSRKPADYLIMARVHDRGLTSLVASFPGLVGTPSGMAWEPHVTLFGPFWLLGQEALIIRCIEQAVSGKRPFSCRIRDLIRLKGMKGGAIAFRVSPGADLAAGYSSLITSLAPRASRISWIDRPPGQRIFHISLRFNIPFNTFDVLWERVQALPPSPRYDPEGQGKASSPLLSYLPAGDSPLPIFRIALLRRGSLWKEYDIPRSLWLTRAAAYDTDSWQKTYAVYRMNEGMELQQAGDSSPGTRFVFADLHLGHQNIIQYCRRPFSSAPEMDRVLMGNWNFTVPPGGEVFYLGDLRHGIHALPAAHYLARMNGRIQVISGNHDHEIPGAVASMRLQHGDLDFFLIHNPAQAPRGIRGWVMHGHLHNNDLCGHPFINAETRTVNVSAELVNYMPLNLDELCTFLKKTGPGDRVATLNEARKKFPAG